MPFFLCTVVFKTFLFWRRVVSQLSTYKTWHTQYFIGLYYYFRCTTYLVLFTCRTCIFRLRVLLALRLLLVLCRMYCYCCFCSGCFAVGHPVPHSKSCCWFIESYSIPCYSLPSNTVTFHGCILGSTIAFTASNSLRKPQPR